MNRRWRARFWVDVILTAPDEEAAKALAKRAQRWVGFDGDAAPLSMCKEVEEYDTQFKPVD